MSEAWILSEMRRLNPGRDDIEVKFVGGVSVVTYRRYPPPIMVDHGPRETYARLASAARRLFYLVEERPRLIDQEIREALDEVERLTRSPDNL